MDHDLTNNIWCSWVHFFCLTYIIQDPSCSSHFPASGTFIKKEPNSEGKQRRPCCLCLFWGGGGVEEVNLDDVEKGKMGWRRSWCDRRIRWLCVELPNSLISDTECVSGHCFSVCGPHWTAVRTRGVAGNDIAFIAKLQIQPESGGRYIRLVGWSFVGTLRLSRQEQTRLSPEQTILDKARPDQTRPEK